MTKNKACAIQVLGFSMVIAGQIGAYAAIGIVDNPTDPATPSPPSFIAVELLCALITLVGMVAVIFACDNKEIEEDNDNNETASLMSHQP